MAQIIHGMSNADYHADNSAISASGLKLFMRSPMHYWSAYLDPNRKPTKPTEAMKLGTAVHCAILEPEHFDSRYVVLPEDINLRTTEGKALKAAMIAGGAEVIDADDYARIKTMAANFRATKEAQDLFSQPHHVEVSIFAEVNGVKCKCRPDLITDSFASTLDVKSTKDASKEEFGKSAWNLGYHIQSAFYRRVIREATGADTAFSFGCVESSAPYLCANYAPPQFLLDYADMVIDGLLDQYAECLKTGVWPGYSEGMTELYVPGYAQKIIENEGIEDWEISHV